MFFSYQATFLKINQFDFHVNYLITDAITNANYGLIVEVVGNRPYRAQDRLRVRRQLVVPLYSQPHTRAEIGTDRPHELCVTAAAEEQKRNVELTAQTLDRPQVFELLVLVVRGGDYFRDARSRFSKPRPTS